MKIATIVGARPQFIKATVVSAAFRAQAAVQEVMIHTGQHYDDNMSAVFVRPLRRTFWPKPYLVQWAPLVNR